MQIKLGSTNRVLGWSIALLVIVSMVFIGLGVVSKESKQSTTRPVQLAKSDQHWESYIRDYWHDAGYLALLDDWNTIEHERELEALRFVLIPTRPGLPFQQIVQNFRDDLESGMYLASMEHNQDVSEVTIWVGQAVSGSDEIKETFILQLAEMRPLLSSAAHGISEGGDSVSQLLAVDQEDSQARLAIVIDDWGYRSTAIDPLLLYPFPLTVAVLPYLPLSQTVADRASRFGHEVILHQPMEPLNTYLDMGEGGISTEMTSDQIRSQLQRNLAHLPMVSGVNNHMGSKATADQTTMTVVLETLRAADLYFLDSLTSPLTVTRQVAESLSMPYAINNLFIDNVNEEEAIRQQIRLGIALAKRRGQAIVIGHVRPQTAAALWYMIPEIVAADVMLVPVSQLLTYADTASLEFTDDSEEGGY